MLYNMPRQTLLLSGWDGQASFLRHHIMAKHTAALPLPSLDIWTRITQNAKKEKLAPGCHRQLQQSCTVSSLSTGNAYATALHLLGAGPVVQSSPVSTHCRLKCQLVSTSVNTDQLTSNCAYYCLLQWLVGSLSASKFQKVTSSVTLHWKENDFLVI